MSKKKKNRKKKNRKNLQKKNLKSGQPRPEAKAVSNNVAADLEKLFRAAVSLHQNGKSDDAEKIYQRILAVKPDHSDSLHLLGLIAHHRGEYDSALELIDKALGIFPDNPIYYYNRGNVFVAQKDFDKAAECYGKALEFNPKYIEACNNMGSALKDCGRAEDAAECYRKALNIQPDYADAHYNLGIVLADLRQPEEAVKCYQKVTKLRPDHAEAYFNMGTALVDIGRSADAIDAYRKAAEIRPDYVEAHNELGIELNALGKTAESLKCYQKVLDIRPDCAEAYNNMGVALRNHGDPRKAVECYKKVLEIEPDNAVAHSNLLFSYQYNADHSHAWMYEQHRKWSEVHEKPLKGEILPHANDRTPDRRLRIGYVSPDFRSHSCAYFIEPLLRAHDKTRAEIFCYSDVRRSDDITERIMGLADHWRNVFRKGHEYVAEKIREDQIDVLVDLTGHTAKHRLLVFSRKPAPIQVSWLGYPDTTGMDVMDYRLTDAVADPEGVTDSYQSETLVRIPNGFLCYAPPEKNPDVAPLPVIKEKWLTFGSFNNLTKVTEHVIEVWSEILRQIPRSRLFLKSRQMANEETRQNYLKMFSENGIASERITTTPRTPSQVAHLDLYKHVDIALDPFPYNGTTTSCEALWMGVPFIALAGDRHVSRVGISILHQAGLTELIADSEADYIAKAVQLGKDIDRLKTLRTTLREHTKNSWLCNAAEFAKSLEDAYLGMWRKWCDPEYQFPSADFRAERSKFQVPAAIPRAPTPEFEKQEDAAGNAPAKIPDAEFQVPEAEFKLPEPELHRQGYAAGDAPVKIPDAEFQVPETEFKLPEPKFQIPEPEFQIPKPEFQMPESEFKVPTPEFRMPEPEFKLPTPESEVGSPPPSDAQKPEFDIRKEFNKAVKYHESGQLGKAEAIYQKILKVNPKHPDALHLHGVIAFQIDKHDIAIHQISRAIQLNPDNPIYYHNMGSALSKQGRMEEAITCYRKVLSLRPEYSEAYCNLLLTLQYMTKPTLNQVFQEHLRWGALYGKPFIGKIPPHLNAKDPKKRLRVGYVSPDFRNHSCAYFLEPLLKAHDKAQVEIFCYAEVARGDDMTERIKSLSDHWYNTVGKNHDIVARQIRDDRIDILVDLAGHTAKNRLLIFVRKPAPIQLAWLGYPDTTGMASMDYRFTDAVADPPGKTDPYFTETLIRLPNGFLSYTPPPDTPDVGELPCLKSGHITFGSFNNLIKVNEEVAAAWSEILHKVPNSVLLLKSRQFVNKSTRKQYTEMFAKNNIPTERVIMRVRIPSKAEHMGLYNEVDIGLDPFPYNGTTTTCEAMWMGVPVITLRGDRHRARVGTSILTRIGLTELSAESREDYIVKAVRLAGITHP